MKRLFKKVTALVLGLLTVAGLAGLNSNSVEPVVKAEAITMTGGEVLYLKPNSNWTQSSARFAIYVFGTGNAWASMEECPHNDGIYKATVPTGNWTKLIFVRMNGSSTSNNWDNKWNQTGDLTYDGTKNLFTVPSGAWDGSTSGWSQFTPQACFTYEGGHSVYLDVGTWSSDSAKFSVYLFSCDSKYVEKWVSMDKVPNEEKIYTIVIPEGKWCGIIFCRMNSTSTSNKWENVWNQTVNNYNQADKNLLTLSSSLNSDKKLTGKWSFYLTPNCEALIEGLKTTNTCVAGTEETISDDAAIAEYKENVANLRAIYNGLCADEQKYIKDTKLDDDVTSYLERLKFLELKASLFETTERMGDNLLSNITSSNNILMVLIVGLLGLTTVGAYYFLNKKKYAK